MDTHARHLDVELNELQGKLVRMATVAERMIDQAIGELQTRNAEQVSPIAAEEQELNRLQLEIDELALALLATRQPVAADLRTIMAATRINSELERIGDLVINITECAATIVQQPPLKPLIDIPRMAELARGMVRRSVEAFLAGDVALAQSVLAGDDEVDALKDQVFRELLTYMMADPRTTERAMALILVARHLERIADHATNIAQDVIYMVQGRDVRHPKLPR